jgi:DNA-binding HxlR family transcriptional regulator
MPSRTSGLAERRSLTTNRASSTLRHLERDGLVERTVYPTAPPRVDYALTPLGASLHTTIKALVVWTEGHQNEIASARTAYDRRAAAEEALQST